MQPFLHSWFTHSFSYFKVVLPWLIVGIGISFLLKRFLREGIVKRFLGGSSLLTILIAEAIGAFSPVSIIALLPLASTMLAEGASPATLAAFLLAARAYNPEALPVSLSLLGLKITILNLLITFTAVTLCALMLKNSGLVIKTKDGSNSSFVGQVFAFSGYIIIGIIVAGLIITAVPAHAIAHYGGGGILSIPLVMLFGFLIYLGFVGYFPIAKSFLDLGVSHAAVITFLNSASIINLTFLLMFMPVIGKKNTLKVFFIYLATVLVSGAAMSLLRV
jgi:uncharacterized membrane protein YraQ (UPF0718 family)